VVKVQSAKGHYFTLESGQKILDAAGGAIAAPLGHGNEEIKEAIATSVGDSGYILPPWSTPERERLTDRLLSSWLPPHLSRIYLGSGGSDTIDAALRTARYYHLAKKQPERWKVIYRDLSYHGAGLSQISISGHAGRRRGLEPYFPNMPCVPTPYPLRYSPTNELPDAGVAAAKALEETFEREGPETIAAFIAEPINGSSGGAIQPPDSYWPAVTEICKRYDILLIIDEVMTGFGRTGAKFAIEHWGIEPDIMISGKGLAGGYAALGGVYARPEMTQLIADEGLAPMYYTFGGLPSACAAADKLLEIIEREDLVHRVATKGIELGEKLSRLAQHEHVAEVRGRGFFWGVEVVKDKDTLEHFPAEDNVTSKIIGNGMKDGVFFYPGGTGAVRDIVAVGPPFTLEDDEIDFAVDTLARAIDSATK
jgi:adenosylmethionine-8-amino-7-oxononanoate aminotransferase